jgi:hypothetical protein
VLSEAGAARLARRAGRLRGGGSRAPLAWRAWRILADAGDRGDQAAIDAVWQAWLSYPDDERWQVLCRWREPRAMAAAVFAAATDPARSPASRAAIGAFCAGDRMAPDDPAERALFLVLCGRSAEHRAADADVSLIAAGYLAAGDPTRSAVRRAMTDADDLDLAHVIADQRNRAEPMTGEEREYLIRHLAGEGDWERLWCLIQDLPLAGAVASLRHFGDEWEPGSAADGALFGLLARADPEEIARARDALDASAVSRIALDAEPTHGAFSLDGRRLAVATRNAISVFEVPGMILAERYPLDVSVFGASRLLHAGDGVIVGGYRGRFDVLMRYAGGRGAILRRQACMMLLAPHPAGFVVLHVARGSNQWHREGGYRLELRTVSGEPLRDVSLPADLGFPGSGRGPWTVAAHPGTGKIALGGDRLWILDPDATRVLASCDSPGPITAGTWIGSDRIAAALTSGKTALNDSLGIFRVAGSELELEATSDDMPDPGDVHVRYGADLVFHGTDLVFIPERGEIAMLGKHDQQVVYLDAQTLASIDEPRELTGRRGTRLWASPDDHYHALAGPGHGGTVQLVDRSLHAVRTLACRPMGAIAPADLNAVNIATRRASPGFRPLPFLELLRACLEYRFASDTGDRPAPAEASGRAE